MLLKSLVVLAAAVTRVCSLFYLCSRLFMKCLGRLSRGSPQLYNRRDYLSRVCKSLSTRKWFTNQYLASWPTTRRLVKSQSRYMHIILPVQFALNISQREWDTYNPITDPLDLNIACNVDGSSLGSGQLSATVPAGSQIKATWNQWPHTVGRKYRTVLRVNRSQTQSSSISQL